MYHIPHHVCSYILYLSVLIYLTYINTGGLLWGCDTLHSWTEGSTYLLNDISIPQSYIEWNFRDSIVYISKNNSINCDMHTIHLDKAIVSSDGLECNNGIAYTAHGINKIFNIKSMEVYFYRTGNTSMNAGIMSIDMTYDNNNNYLGESDSIYSADPNLHQFDAITWNSNQYSIDSDYSRRSTVNNDEHIIDSIDKNDHLIAVYHDDNSINLYYNGVLYKTYSGNNIVSFNENMYRILFCKTHGPVLFSDIALSFEGIIIKAAIYDYSLSSNDALYLYQHRNVNNTKNMNQCAMIFTSPEPTSSPTNNPTSNPSNNPTNNPSIQPTVNPTLDPSIPPTINPTLNPSVTPTVNPTPEPSLHPTNKPTNYPTYPTPAPIEGQTSSPTVYIDIEFKWNTPKYNYCDTFKKAKNNIECYVNNGPSMSRIRLSNTFIIYGNDVFGLKRRLQSNEVDSKLERNIKWILIDYGNNVRYVLNDYGDRVSVLNTKFIDNNGDSIIESRLIVNSLYTKWNGYCIDNELLNEWIMKPNKLFGFHLEIFGNNNNNRIISYKSDVIYLKTRAIPQNGYCNIIANDDAGLFDEFQINCDKWDITNNNNNNDNNIYYNVLSNNILWSNIFVTNITTLKGTIKTGNTTYIVIIEDDYKSRTCNEITQYWPDINQVLTGTNVSSIQDNINNILNETSSDISNNIETIDAVINVVKELYFNNITNINEASSIISDVVTNIADSIANQNINTTNKTVIQQQNELTNKISLIKDTTKTNEIITQQTGELILNNIVNNVFDTTNNLVNINNNNSNNSNNIIETTQLISVTIDTIVNIDTNNKMIIDTNLQENTNNLFGKGASIALKNKEIGEQFTYNHVVMLSDESVYEVSVSSTKIGKPALRDNDNITAVNIEPPKCVTNGVNNTQYSLTFPDGFFNNNTGDVYHCTITQTSENNYNDSNNDTNPESNIVIANIFDQENLVGFTSDLCAPYLIEIDINADILNDNIDAISNSDNNIFYPNCTFWNITSNEFDNNNCYVYNFTNHSVICACNHLTTFKVKISDVIPKVNKLQKWHFRNITFDNIIKHPTVVLTIFGFSLLSIILCLLNPRSKNNNDIPSLAYEDIIIKDFKNEKFKTEQYAYEIDLLNKYMPNSNKLGNGLIPLITRNSITTNKMDDIDKHPKCNLCYLQLKLYLLYLGNDHTILSMFQRTSGTNFSTRQRIACFFMYICTIMIANAIFFGVEQPIFGGITASFIASLISTIPVFIVRFIFKSSKPKIIERTLKLKDKVTSIEGKERRNSTLNNKDYVDDLRKIRKKKQNTKIKYARNIIKKVHKNGDINERYELVNEFRMIIFNQIYDLPYKCRYIGVMIIILWTSFCIVLAIVYGLSFDILYPYRPDQYFPVTLQSTINEPIIPDNYGTLNCRTNIVGYNIETKLSIDYADVVDTSLKEYLTKSDNFGINITDSGTWLISLGLSLLLSIFIWQPLNIYIKTWIKLWSFTLNLSLNTKPGTIKRICKKVCCCKTISHNNLVSLVPSFKPQTSVSSTITSNKQSDGGSITRNNTQSNNEEIKLINDDDIEYIDHTLFTERKKSTYNTKERNTRSGIVVNENRPMDILSFFSHDILFINNDNIYNDTNIDTNIETETLIDKENITNNADNIEMITIQDPNIK